MNIALETFSDALKRIYSYFISVLPGTKNAFINLAGQYWLRFVFVSFERNKKVLIHN